MEHPVREQGGSPRRIHRLLDQDAYKVLSASGVPTVCSVLEELVLNAIDAEATRIEIHLDLSSFNVEVKDNGMGMDSRDVADKVGQWHCTSKNGSHTHGCKGLALASIRQLAESVDVITRRSKARGGGPLVHKRLTPNSCETSVIQSTATASELLDKGTIVKVRNLFHGLIVRRESIRIEIEKSNIITFLHNMSMLHHSVSWLLVDEQSKDHKPLMCLSATRSVSKRILTLHGIDSLACMQSLSFTDGVQSIEGLLSVPSTQHCSIAKDCQYLYINNRWMRNQDPISIWINKVFGKCLSENWNYGPSAKHVKTQCAKYPRFVLKYQCPAAHIDVLLEPNKSQAIFKDIDRVRTFICKCLKAFSGGRYPALEMALSESVNGHRESTAPAPIAANAAAQIINRRSRLSWDDIINGDHIVPEKAPTTSKRNLFAAAFDFSEDDLPCTPPRSKKLAVDHIHRFGVVVSRDSGVIHASTPSQNGSPVAAVDLLSDDSDRELLLDDSSASRSSPDKGRDTGTNKASLPCQKDIAFAAVDLLSSDSDPELNMPQQDQLLDDASRSSPDEGSRIDDLNDNIAFTSVAADDDHSDPPVLHGDTAETTVLTGFVQHSLSGAEAVSSQVEEHIGLPQKLDKDSASIPLIITTTLSQDVQLERKNLHDMSISGQFADKFIVCMLGPVLLLFDQHAVDERIRFEVALATIKSSSMKTVLVGPKQIYSITFPEKSVYSEFIHHFLEWGFEYKLSSSTLALQLVRLPIFLEEQLTFEDMQEFNHYISANRQLPVTRLVPPSCLRIAASRACRYSIKFGTSLSTETMSDLLTKLSATNLPFQCAHGRPSVLPIAQLKSILTERSRKRASRIQLNLNNLKNY